VRLAGPRDIPRISAIRLAVRENRLRDPEAVTPAMVAEFMDEIGQFFVFEEQGRILGFSAADFRDGHIWALFVDPDHEGRGIGRALLDRACAVLLARGHLEANLNTGAGTRAERFYRRDGWRETGRDAHGEILFRKAL
jgi:GNAT superfamily N-acetyltransferase